MRGSSSCGVSCPAVRCCDRHVLVKTVTLDRSGAVRTTTIVAIIAIAVAAFILVANVKIPVPKQDTLAERREEAKQTGREIKSVSAVDLHENSRISRSQTVSECVEFYHEMFILV